MKQGPNGKNRPRGRNNNNNNSQMSKGRGPSRNQVYDSNGPGIRVRGNAHQVVEKYQALARDAAAQGDRVLCENYLQHAEHYLRIILAINQNNPQRAFHLDQSQALVSDGPDDFLDENEESFGEAEVSVPGTPPVAGSGETIVVVEASTVEDEGEAVSPQQQPMPSPAMDAEADEGDQGRGRRRRSRTLRARDASEDERRDREVSGTRDNAASQSEPNEMRPRRHRSEPRHDVGEVDEAEAYAAVHSLIQAAPVPVVAEEKPAPKPRRRRTTKAAAEETPETEVSEAADIVTV